MGLIPADLASLSQLEMLPGQRMEFVLPEPASTGALWRVEKQEGIRADLVHDVPVEDVQEQARIIVGGMGRVRLVLQAPGQPCIGEMKLVLSRSWEKQAYEEFSIRVRVSPING